MKFTIALIAVLLISSVMSIKPYRLSNAQMEKIDKLKNGNTWASILLNLAELHMLAEGPLEELIGAIHDVVEDLNTKLTKAAEDFDTRTALYEAEVSRLNGEIDNAKLDVANTEQLLQNVLYVMKAQLEEDIDNLQLSITNTHTYIAEITAEREAEHAEFEKKILEHEGAIAAIDECLALLAQLGPDSSFVQIKRVKNALAKAQKKLGHSVEARLVNALVSLTTGEFADEDAIQNVVKLMVDVQNNLRQNVEDFTNQENRAQSEFEAEVAAKTKEINTMELEVTEKSEQLEKTKNQIAEAEAFLAFRKRDLADYEADLEATEKSYEHDTEVYNDLVAQFTLELDACAEALKLLESAEFAGYLSKRMGMDNVIDQAQGSSVEVY